MARLRTMLLVAIGVLSGASMAIGGIGRRVKRAAAGLRYDIEDARLLSKPEEMTEPYPAIGRKGGAPETLPGPPGASRFATATNRARSLQDEPAAPAAGTAEPVSGSDADSPYPEYARQRRHDTALKNVRWPFGYLRELFERFNGDYCPAWAASLSFFSILSLAPILLCSLAILGYVIRDPAQATREVQEALSRVLPGSSAATARQAAELIRTFNVERAVETLHAQRGVAAVIGILSLLWSSMQIFVNAATPMNAAFRTHETRSWLKRHLVAFCLLLGAGLLFVCALAPSYIAQHVSQLRLNIGVPPVLLTLAGVVLNAVMFAVIYRYLPSPSAKVTWRAAWLAGGIVAVLWEIAKEAFAWYLTRFAHYDKVYGTLGTFIGLLFWIYYTSMILLLGAEIAKLYLDAQERK